MNEEELKRKVKEILDEMVSKQLASIVYYTAGAEASPLYPNLDYYTSRIVKVVEEGLND